MVRLDIGCGPNKQPDHIGVDAIAFDGVDVVLDVRGRWPWDDNSVESVHCSHFLEHLDGSERVHFFNELYRVLKPEGTAFIVTPDWSSQRAYGDPTHKWPPVCAMAYLYVDAEWRKNNAPHTGYECDFQVATTPTIHPLLIPRNAQFQEHALAWYKEAAQDLTATLVKR